MEAGSNIAPQTEPLADEPVEPSKELRTLAAVDAALAPVFRSVDNLGVVSYGELKHALICMRQALYHVVYGPPEHPTPEPVDALAEQRAAAEQPPPESTSGTASALPPSTLADGEPEPYAAPGASAVEALPERATVNDPLV